MAIGDKKPVVMEGDIGELVPPKLHAAQHAADGADPITPSMIGAVPQIAKYYSETFSADDLLVPFALIPVSTSSNPELHAIVKGSFAYVRTYFYAGITTTSKRAQLAFTYNSAQCKMAFRIYGANGWTAWTEIADTDYAVNKAGDTMTGSLKFAKVSNGYSTFDKNHSATSDQGLRIRDYDANGNQLMVRLSAALKSFQLYQDGASQNILHTGNKPSGSYTGNGNATARGIATGGIGSVVAIWGGSQVTLLTANGGVNYDSSSEAIRGVPYSEAHFYNGTITLATTTSSVNASGITYKYQVL